MIDPALQSLAVPVASLNPDPANTRRHDQRNIDVIKASLTRFGQRKPIVVQKKGMIVRAGNGTLQAAKELGWTEIAAVVLDDDDLTATAFSIADNRSAELATWQEPDLARLLKELEKDMDLSELGFDAAEMSALLDAHCQQDGQTDDDVVPDMPETCDIQRGDLFQLGSHRLLCGDATSEADFARLMGGEKASITFTSPPYNLGVSAKLRGNTQIAKQGTVYNHNADDDAEGWLILVTKSTQLSLLNSRYVFYNIQPLAGNRTVLWQWAEKFSEYYCDLMVWDKQHAPPQQAERVVNSRFELIWIFTSDKNPNRAIRCAPFFRGTVDNVFVGNPQRNNIASDIHGATFPVEFPLHFISKFCEVNNIALDPFLGSGSTLIACEKLQRRLFGIEISPHYCAIILKRWEDFTGKKAVKLT